MVGEVVPAGTPAIRLVDTRAYAATIGLMRDEVASVSPGTKARVSAGTHTTTGYVDTVSPVADPRTHDWKATLRIDAPSFPAGSSVAVELMVEAHPDTVSVPSSAVTDGRVWRMHEGTVRQVDVEVVAELRDRVLLRGLAVGDPIVRFASAPLFDGATIVELASP